MNKTNFLRYDAHKDSGIERLGGLPQHWTKKRLKDIGIDGLINGIFKTKDQFGSGVKLVNVIDLYQNDNIINKEKLERIRATTNEINKYSVQDGDIFFVRSSLKLEGIGVSAIFEKGEEATVFECHIIRYRPNQKHIFPRFVIYQLNSNEIRYKFIIVSKTVTMTTISQEKISTIDIVYPPLPEQKTIANFLDAKTAQIDRKIELLTKKVEKYAELKQSLINETVKHGLDKSVPMKASGVEWVGQIPTHWEVRRISDIAVQQKSKNTGMREKNLLSLSYGKLKRKDIETSFGLLPESFETYQIVNKGNMILRLTDLQNDWTSLRVGLAKERGIITSAYLCLRFSKSVNPTFAYYLLHVYDLSKVFYWLGNGLRSTMKFEDIKVLPFILPTIEEQKAISIYLDAKTLEIERILETIKAEIEKLKELRKTLINDVVTGKIKVIEENASRG